MRGFTARKASHALIARLVQGAGAPRQARLTATFQIGAAPGCALRTAGPGVAPQHVQVVYDGILWWIRDLGSEAGTFLDGGRIQFAPLSGRGRLELGRGGPLVELELSAPRGAPAGDPTPAPGVAARTTPPAAAPLASETQIIRRYLGPPDDRPAGERTMLLRRAFARVQRRSVRRYRTLAAGAALVLLLAGAVIAHQARRLGALRATAERLFYATRTLELQIAKLEDVARLGADPAQLRELEERRGRVRSMEREYQAFVEQLGARRRPAPDERVIAQVARAFGECDLELPRGFVAEVRRYVERWRASGRLARALERAQRRGYAAHITGALAAGQLPAQYLYLAAQESGFDERAVGPVTRFGHAKGMWQFLPATAQRYGLRVGPLQGGEDFDPQDDRFDWQKATAAAVRYLRDLQAGRAQGSGLLAMASYNSGEERVGGILDALPEDPAERNFWRLLADRDVPRETYDYVLSIFSAAVICEDPRLFGFDLACPAAGATGERAER